MFYINAKCHNNVTVDLIYFYNNVFLVSALYMHFLGKTLEKFAFNYTGLIFIIYLFYWLTNINIFYRKNICRYSPIKNSLSSPIENDSAFYFNNVYFFLLKILSYGLLTLCSNVIKNITQNFHLRELLLKM